MSAPIFRAAVITFLLVCVICLSARAQTVTHHVGDPCETEGDGSGDGKVTWACENHKWQKLRYAGNGTWIKEVERSADAPDATLTHKTEMTLDERSAIGVEKMTAAQKLALDAFIKRLVTIRLLQGLACQALQSALNSGEDLGYETYQRISKAWDKNNCDGVSAIVNNALGDK